MKIILAGGGTGGHFYPLIAVAEELNQIISDENIADSKIYFLSDAPYDQKALFENRIIYKKINAGKLRLTPSFKSIPDLFKLVIGTIQTFFLVFSIFPDVIFSKGGYAAFPVVFAGRILRIPIIIHESDSAVGRVNLWSAKFAKEIALSYKQAKEVFKNKENIIHTGQPIRRDLLHPVSEGAHEFLSLDKEVPVVWILGGSLGAQKINYAIESILPELLQKYQVIHQVGEKNLEEMEKMTEVLLKENPYRNRYHIFGSLNPLSMKMVAGVADIVITRAGSALFEIAHWEVPAIIIPITHSHGNHQMKNAYNYAREGGGVVIEENNLSSQLLLFEINRIYDNEKVKESMKQGAREFGRADAAQKIAEEIIRIGLSHEK
ncbi:MAG: UDP-N-acetylglucosamine--N-acetylmuramyl-(pentapeptide) pyrophosphoryl-undecaprenol N-acetylglucosamine transferase [Candidatus Pacebacteria bacterium]|nr:UDP-N-acetylglucosamine--N-acetylmuramyl-(pentapeptide) pyrophosphoryl-undecaprenol N-acetylglucosamine transferase [Candidatus Paceibacterota bacterium]